MENATPRITKLDGLRALPGEAYTSDAVYARELERIFLRSWLCAGRAADLDEPGTYRLHELGPESIVVSRAEDGALHAFFNVCRHRGARLLDQPAGTGCRAFTCPYHAWVYGLDGSLLNAPLMADRADFRPEDFPLVRVSIELWEGFYFLSLAERPEPLASQLADLPDLARYGLEDLRVAHRTTYRVRANWKVLCENYSECYHCALVHPQLHRLSHYLSGGEQESGVSFVGGPMQLRPGFDTMGTTGTSDRRSLPGLGEDELDAVLYYVIYPNFLLSLHRDYVLTHTLWPHGPHDTQIHCAWLFHPDEIARDDFDPSDAVEFWDLTNRQDWGVCERVQRGVASRGYRPSRLQAGETCVAELDRWYRARMRP